MRQALWRLPGLTPDRQGNQVPCAQINLMGDYLVENTALATGRNGDVCVLSSPRNVGRLWLFLLQIHRDALIRQTLR